MNIRVSRVLLAVHLALCTASPGMAGTAAATISVTVTLLPAAPPAQAQIQLLKKDGTGVTVHRQARPQDVSHPRGIASDLGAREGDRLLVTFQH